MKKNLFLALTIVSTNWPLAQAARVCPKPTPLPTARMAAVAAYGKDNKIYVLGGDDKDDNVNEAFDTSTGRWTQLSPVPARGASGSAVVAALDGTIYLFGGFRSNKVFAYDPKTDQWSPRKDLPYELSNASALRAKDGAIYVIGGSENPSPKDDGRLVRRYFPDTDTWGSAASMPREHTDAAVTTTPDGAIYVIGGICSVYCQYVERFDPANNAWTTITSLNVVRFRHAAFSGADGTLYAIGGWGAESRSSVTAEALSPNASAWKSLPNNPRSLSYLAYAQDDNGFGYIFGGDDAAPDEEDEAPSNAVKVFDIVNGQWCPKI